MALIKTPNQYAKEFEEYKKSKKKNEPSIADLKGPKRVEPPKGPKHPENKPIVKKVVKKKLEPDYEEEYIHVNFELKPIHLERAIYGTVIVALILITLFNPIADYVDFKKQVAIGNITLVEYETVGAVTTDENSPPEMVAEMQPAETTSDTGQEAAVEPVDDPVLSVDPAPEEEPEAEVAVGSDDEGTEDTVVVPSEIAADNLELTIEELIFDDKGDWAKITGVKVKLVNNGPKLSPDFRAYVYDEQTKSYGVDLERGAIKYDMGIPFGDSITTDIDLDKTASYNDPDTLIYVIVKLYDAKSGEYIMDATRSLRIDF